jgi:C_GCAxxG_C_C family probable redox protein
MKNEEFTMNPKESFDRTRRNFLRSLSGFAVSGGLWTMMTHVQDPEKQKRLFRDPFNPDELEAMKRSNMAWDLEKYTGKGYSCAESILMVSLCLLGKPKEWVRAAAAFGGGLGKGELCGFLTGGMMAIGIAAGMMNSELKTMHKLARERSNAYWDWWQQWGPVHCRDLRKQYQGNEEFLRFGHRAAMKVESLIKAAVN